MNLALMMLLGVLVQVETSGMEGGKLAMQVKLQREIRLLLEEGNMQFVLVQ